MFTRTTIKVVTRKQLTRNVGHAHDMQMLEALLLAFAHIDWCWDTIENNTLLTREGSGTIHLKIAQAISAAHDACGDHDDDDDDHTNEGGE